MSRASWNRWRNYLALCSLAQIPSRCQLDEEISLGVAHDKGRNTEQTLPFVDNAVAAMRVALLTAAFS